MKPSSPCLRSLNSNLLHKVREGIPETSVSDPDPDLDPVGSGIISRIQIGNSNFGSGEDPEEKFRRKTDFFYLTMLIHVEI